MTLDVLYEDDTMMVVNKPAGRVIHPTYKHAGGTLLDALRSYGGDWADGQNPTIVGRLDKDTSGIVIAAKTATIHAMLQRILSLPESEKDYLAVVRGSVDAERGAITLPLRIDASDRRRVVVATGTDSGWPSETRFERLDRRGGISVLRCRLVTGRRHQIRVHLAARGWPIVGDRVYGLPLDGFKRHALHAWRTAFAHPISGDRLTIEAPLPPEIQRLLNGSDPAAPP